MLSVSFLRNPFFSYMHDSPVPISCLSAEFSMQRFLFPVLFFFKNPLLVVFKILLLLKYFYSIYLLLSWTYACCAFLFLSTQSLILIIPLPLSLLGSLGRQNLATLLVCMHPFISLIFASLNPLLS